MSTRMTMPKKEAEDAEAAPAGQKRAPLARYRLQVDRQTKDTFTTHEAAATAGAAIKKAYPIVQVTIYDAQETVVTIL
jgi:hypothetical protein